MSLSVRDYASRVRDSKWERDLARELRKVPENERLEFVKELAVANPAVALILARKCLADKHSFESLLDQAINEANSSGIRYWLEAIVPRLGIRRVVAHLRRQSFANPEGVAQAAYWLPMFSKLPGFSRSDVEALLSV